jgi:protein TonB
VGPSDPATRDIGDVVLGAGSRERRGRMAVALVAALAAHAVMLLAVRGTEGGHATKAPLQPVQMEARVYEIDVAAPAPPPVLPPPPQRAVVERHMRAPELRARPTAAPPPEVGRAASVVAPAPDPGAPLDLTGDGIVTGQATAYAGGVTSSAGTSVAPGRAGAATTSGTTDAIVATAIDRASPVSLESESWSCPWPREADSEQIDEQTVILRVVVNASGTAEKATVLADPGHGFGAAAVACALRTRFVPARGRSGEVVRSTSPPIRVRFTR